jgi:uncharacterized repeat protein (TIGR01451 family)
MDVAAQISGYRTIGRVLATLGLLVTLLVVTSVSAYAATFPVNSVLDEPDAVPGDGNCVSTPSAVCTLRAAAMESNALAGDDIITLPVGTVKLSIVPPSPAVPDVEAHGDVDLLTTIAITGAGQSQSFVGVEPGAIGPSITTIFEVHPGASVTMEAFTIQGPKSINSDTGIGVSNAGTLGLTDMTVTDANSTGVVNSGTLTAARARLVANVPLEDFKPAHGLINSGTATLTDVDISENGQERGGGSGITNSGTLTISRALISGNSSLGLDNTGTAALTNVSVSENTSRGGDAPGIRTANDLTLTNVTVTGNLTVTNPGPAPGLRVSSGTASLKNTIIAQNGQSGSGSNDNECAGGGIISLGNNLQGDTTCGLNGPGDITAADPKLGPLANNGGPTRTHALLVASPAIDSGTNSGCPSSDQRNVARPIDGDANGTAICDIGAYEAPKSAELSIVKSHVGSFAVGQNGVYTITVYNAFAGAPTAGPITVNDSLPTGLSFISGTGTDWSCSAIGQAVTCTRGTAIDPGTNSAITLTVGVASQAMPAITNTATVSHAGDFSSANNSSSDPTTVNPVGCGPRPSVGLQVVQTGPGTGPGRLRATLTANTSPQKPANGIVKIKILTATNAAVDDLNGQNNLTSGEISFPNVPSTSFIVRRISAAGQAFTIQIEVTDACSVWRTVVGGGTSVP